jgi:hypothetical protein
MDDLTRAVLEHVDTRELIDLASALIRTRASRPRRQPSCSSSRSSFAGAGTTSISRRSRPDGSRRSPRCADVRQVLETGQIIERYPDDVPYASQLVLGWIGSRPIHVVAADNFDAHEAIVITVYEPDPGQWEPGFRQRRRA